MDEYIDEEQIKKKIEEGWIRVWAAIEVMAVNKDVTKKALKKHLEKLKKEKGIHIFKEKFDKIEKVEHPPRNIKEAYSQVVEIEFIIDGIRNLVHFVFLYGPSAVEILEPSTIKSKIGEVQDMLNTIATIIHQYAARGVGGIVVSPK
jgi:hypothetical protein